MMFRNRSTAYTALLLLVCIATRLMTAVHYIADPDSLRFALGVVDYDVAALQPHFPGYPVFCFATKLLYWLLGSYSLAFAVVGGLSVFALILFSLKFVKARIDSPEGLLLAVLILFNPMIWLMSNRYMPDLTGAAVAVGILTLTIRKDNAPERNLLLGLLLVGLLAGVRLSYLPLVMLPTLIAFGRSQKKVQAIMAFGAGILVWLIPMIADTGWTPLVNVATQQTTGHFTEFGGTIDVVPDIETRRVAVVKEVVADGLGGYWYGRAEITILVTLGLLICFGRGAWWMFHRETDGLVITVLCIVFYLIWILLYQNVVYQNRHVLPLLPILLYPVWAGGVQLLQSNIVGRFVAVLFLLAYTTVGTVIATQQVQPTAIAQASNYLSTQNNDDRIIFSSSLVNAFLHGTGVKGKFVSADDLNTAQTFAAPPLTGKQVIVPGWYTPFPDQQPDSVMYFHHNPYVNSVWPEVPVAFYTR